MIKQTLKKLLPDTERIQRETGASCLRRYLLNPVLWHINRKSIARGVAIGLLIAFVPLPCQMLLAAGLAMAWQANLPIAIAFTWVTNPITFVPINFFIYQVGHWLTHDPAAYQAVADVNLTDFSFADGAWQTWASQLWQWLHGIGKPFLVGLPVVAVAASLGGYVLVRLGWWLSICWRLAAKRTPRKTH